MGKIANRVGTLGVLAAAIALALPGTASADPADPAIAGSCDATLRAGDSGQALTVDAGAPLNAPKVLTVGTGSNSANKPTLSLPVADLTKALNAGDLPIVGPAVTDTVCPGAQNTVNALSATTQSLVAGKPKQPPAPPSSTPPSSTPPPTRKPSPPHGKPQPQPAPPSTPAPDTGTPEAPATPADGGIQLVSFPLTGVNLASNPDLSALIAPGVIAPSAPGLVPPTGTAPAVVDQNSGTAEALPASARMPAKLPLLLAAIALALVAAALSKIWIRRSVK